MMPVNTGRPANSDSEIRQIIMERMKCAFESLQFRRGWTGGLDEKDVWRKLIEVETLYEQQLDQMEAFYQGALAVQAKEIERLKNEAEKASI